MFYQARPTALYRDLVCCIFQQVIDLDHPCRWHLGSAASTTGPWNCAAPCQLASKGSVRPDYITSLSATAG